MIKMAFLLHRKNDGKNRRFLFYMALLYFSLSILFYDNPPSTAALFCMNQSSRLGLGLHGFDQFFIQPEEQKNTDQEGNQLCKGKGIPDVTKAQL